jgi:hypothetical protein
MLTVILLILGSDFPISTAYESQHFPIVQYANNQFYVFWQDLRYYPSDRSTVAARIAEDGTILDPSGVVLMRDRTVRADAASDGTNFLVVLQDSC